MGGPVQVGELGEDALIQIFARGGPAPGADVVVPNGDDAAAFMVPSDHLVVLTTDALVEGVHFDLTYSPPRCVGRKLMAVNLSDLAAMGAEPKHVLLAMALPLSTPVQVAEAIADGIRDQCWRHGVVVIGGNVTRTSGPIVLTATLSGGVARSEVVARRGTRAGDALFVTGQLGDARAGLELASTRRSAVEPEDPGFELFSALVDPVARVSAGRALARLEILHAMCDVSDGLGRDVHRLLTPVGLGARIESHALPISGSLRAHAARAGHAAESYALAGGEDYELLFTAPPERALEIIRAIESIGETVTRIGTVTSALGVEVVGRDGTPTSAPPGFDHFAAPR